MSRHEEPLPGPWCEGLTRRGADGFVCCPWHGEHHRCIIARGTETAPIRLRGPVRVVTQLRLGLPRPAPRVVPLPPLGPQWRPTGARNQRGRPIPGAPYLVAEFRDPQGGRVSGGRAAHPAGASKTRDARRTTRGR